MVQHQVLLAFGFAALAVACGAEPGPPFDPGDPGDPAEPGGSGGSAAGTGGSSVGASGSGAAPDGGGGLSGQGGAGGSAGTGQGGTGPTVTFAQISTLLPGTCGGNLCHTGRQTPFLGNDANLHRTLLDTAVSECGGAPLVVPGDPEGSAIIRLVNRQCTKLGRPFYMPRDCESNPCLPSAQIRTITNWIEAGAPR